VRISKIVDKVWDGAIVLGYLAYLAALAGLLWVLFLNPIRRELVMLLPADVRPAIGIALAIVGGLLLILVLGVCVLGHGGSGRGRHSGWTSPDQAGWGDSGKGQIDCTGM
jgi:hypothetical protein